MRRTTMSVTAIALAAALAGCTAVDRAGGTTAAPTSARAAAYPVRELPHKLYTHCGIDETTVEGRWYEAVEQLSDGNGNPPAGWGNPFQPGTIRLTSPTEAEFHDPAGHVVRFRLRPDATGPKKICA